MLCNDYKRQCSPVIDPGLYSLISCQYLLPHGHSGYHGKTGPKLTGACLFVTGDREEMNVWICMGKSGMPGAFRICILLYTYLITNN